REGSDQHHSFKAEVEVSRALRKRFSHRGDRRRHRELQTRCEQPDAENCRPVHQPTKRLAINTNTTKIPSIANTDAYGRPRSTASPQTESTPINSDASKTPTAFRRPSSATTIAVTP